MMCHEYSIDYGLNIETLQKPTARENLYGPDQVIREAVDGGLVFVGKNEQVTVPKIMVSAG